jgi:Modifier of rudimentary (Mod(r)) protein
MRAVLEIVFEVNNALKTLRIYLDDSFPASAPKMQVIGNLSHPYLDPYNRVINCPHLVNWSPRTSMLSDVVQLVLVGLQVGISTTTSTTSTPIPPPQYSQQYPVTTHHAAPNSPSTTASMAVSSPVIPSIPNEFPELANLSEFQLQRLLNDDIAFGAHVDGVSKIDSLVSFRDEIIASNIRQCEETLSREEEYNCMRKTVADKQATLRSKVNDFNIQSDIQSSQFIVPTENILTHLNLLKEEKDSTAEKMAREFVEGRLDLDDFLKDYTACKTQYHALATKLSVHAKH